MDDLILLHRDKNYFRECLKEIKKIAEDELKLKFNTRKTQIGRLKNGVDFLGYNHKLLPGGKIEMKLRASSRTRLKRHLKNLMCCTIRKLLMMSI